MQCMGKIPDTVSDVQEDFFLCEGGAGWCRAVVQCLSNEVTYESLAEHLSVYLFKNFHLQSYTSFITSTNL